MSVLLGLGLLKITIPWAFAKFTKDWPIKKMTNLELGHFTTIFGYFCANYIYIFHKNEALMVILRG